MYFQNMLESIDGCFREAPAVPQSRKLGRRFLLGAAACSAMTAAAAGMTLPHLPDAIAQMPTSPPETATPPRMTHVAAVPCNLELRDWAVFQERFIKPDGRVIDTFNGGASHTESQGLGMLFAVAFDNRAVFDRIWGWTAAHLGRRTDALHSWRYQPGAANPVADVNNATDGDVLIAAALVRASSLWGNSQHLAAGQAIARDILELLVREVGGRMVLLPAVAGFIKPDHVVVNASYYIFPLIAELQAAYPSPAWARLLTDGRKLIAEAQFGQWRLPPDWLSVSSKTGELGLARDQPPRFSYDAVRVPLFLAWSRAAPQELDRFAAFWGDTPSRAPAWIDLRTGECATYQACGGVVAIAKLVGCAAHAPVQASLPAISMADEYYSGALILLSRLAMREREFHLA